MKTAFDVDAKMIVVLTESGTTARLIAKYRPSMPILALTAIPETARFTQGVVKNSYCVVIGSMIGTDSILFRALDIGRCVPCVPAYLRACDDRRTPHTRAHLIPSFPPLPTLTVRRAG